MRVWIECECECECGCDEFACVHAWCLRIENDARK